MARKLNVVFASAEAAPFVKTGGLGDVAGSLPAYLVAAGANVIVMVPKYSTIAQTHKDQMEHVGQFYVPLGWRNEYCGLERLVYDGVTYLFLDNEHYFDRSYPYGFFDDGERFAFFSKAICESLQYLPDGFMCDVLHCNDWHTAMAPVFLREFYMANPIYQNVKTVFSIHNIAFQGQFTDMLLGDVLGLSHIEPAVRQLRCDERSINYMQGALNYTDAITTVSPTYAWEIRTPEFGEGLDGVLRRRENILSGILNGLDTKRNDPATDDRIHANYTVEDRSGKAACKAALQAELGLEVRDDRPLMVMVTRLTRQKGMDLVTYSLDRILSGGVQVAVLGTGDAEYEEALRYFERTYPGSMAARIEFDPFLSQRMYSGADMFLMPSLFEPCGLSQMIAMRYGTLPIVRETGGLKDTVIPYNMFTGEGTGFTFTHFNGDEMGDAVFRAARTFWDDKDAWNKLVDNAMTADFSWTRSADQYMDLYYGLHPELERYVPFAAEPETPATDDEPKAEPAKAEEKPAAADEDKAADAAVKTADDAPAKAEPAPAESAAKKAATKATKTATAKKPAAKKTTATKTATAKTATAKSTAAKATTAKTTAAKSTATKAAAATKTAASKTTAKAASTKAATATETTAAKAETTTKATTTTKTAAAKTATAKATATKTAKATKTTATKTTSAKAAATKTTATKTTATKATAAAKETAVAEKTTAATATATKTAAAKTTATKATAAKKTTAKATASTAKTTAAKPATAAKATETEEKPAAPKATTVSAARKTTTRKKR
ncbi:glycogen synthase GlgA [Collinsella tanakaei]|uniref:glycogen synthase GlgA n=1 Tax=Collinsella tanakaei TaxID=626935 RepID=UPI001F15C20C|nr:glycogen synthase GlgA [Collinsella tanakaei]MCF2620698.1 glycogen synthase GlgA [Collinsella tanakaei]